MDSTDAPKAAEGSAPNAPNVPNAAKPAGKTPLGGKGAEPAPGTAPAGKDALKDHLSTVAMAVVIVAALVMVVVLQLRKDSHFNDEAWTALSKLRESAGTSADGFEELAQKYRGSDADPFIRLAWAARLYEGGRRDEVEHAKSLLEQVQRENQGNAFLRERVAAQLTAITAELGDPRAQLAAVASTGAAGDTAGVGTASGDPLQLETPESAGGHDEHDGHGH